MACSASSGACAQSVELDWRQKNVALPFFFHQNSRYGRFAYDDFSEYDSGGEVESPQQQQQIVSLVEVFFLFSLKSKKSFFVKYVVSWCWSQTKME